MHPGNFFLAIVVVLSGCEETAKSTSGAAATSPTQVAARSYTVENLPSPRYNVRSRKTWHDPRYEGASTTVSDNFVSTVVGSEFPGGQLSFEWHIYGTYHPGRRNLTNLDLQLHRHLGFERPSYERECNQFSSQWDDETYHVKLEYERNGSDFVAEDVECVAVRVPADVSTQMRFLTSSFQDIAIGIIKSGEVNRIRNENHRRWLWRVAMGEVKLITKS